MNFRDGVRGCHVAVDGQLIMIICGREVSPKFLFVGVSSNMRKVTWEDRYLSAYIQTYIKQKRDHERISYLS